jgi:hypothetical protein
MPRQAKTTVNNLCMQLALKTEFPSGRMRAPGPGFYRLSRKFT